MWRAVARQIGADPDWLAERPGWRLEKRSQRPPRAGRRRAPARQQAQNGINLGSGGTQAASASMQPRRISTKTIESGEPAGSRTEDQQIKSR